MEIIYNSEETMRIDQYVSEYLDISRAKAKELVQSGAVKVNNQTTKASYQLKDADNIIVVYEKQPEEIHLKKEKMDLETVYEDDYLLVVNKPSGLVVHPGAGNKSGTLVNGLLYHMENLSTSNGNDRPGIVHRIDKDTSGLLMVAKDNRTHENLSEQLKNREITREYIALVEGVIEVEAGLIDAPIGRDENNRLKMGVTSNNSKEAITEFEVIKFFKNHTLIKCRLKTGRTHQIRVHFKYIEHPIVGDPLYGKKKTIDVDGQALHAGKLGFIHPKTLEYLEFEIEAPAKFKEVLNEIEMQNND